MSKSTTRPGNEPSVYRFQITLHALPSNSIAGDMVELPEGCFQSIQVDHAALSIPMGVSFEQASAALSVLPRMFIEPDGSFVWRGGAGETAWQVDGVLYDRGGRLLYVEIRGNCPEEQFNQLLSACGWPKTPLLFQLSQQAVYLSELEFRRYAAASAL